MQPELLNTQRERELWLDRPQEMDVPAARLACTVLAGREGSPQAGVLFLHGFQSDQRGTKAEALAAFAAEQGRPLVRFDLSGHGQSSGVFQDGTIGLWRADALSVLDRLTTGRQVLVGSSMGAWLALLLAIARPERVAGLLLLAPAPDFTETLMWQGFSPDIQAKILRDGVWLRPSAYSSEPQPISRALIEEGQRWLVLSGAPLKLAARVRILQGDCDMDVPWSHAFKLFQQIEAPETHFTLIKGGDHRLSSPECLQALRDTLAALCAECDRGE